MRTLIYIRCSTEDQVEKYGLPAQLRACRDYAAQHGMEILEEIADEGISGATLERPGLERLRQMVRAGGVDVVLMLDVDRLSRELGHLLILKPEIEKRARLEFVVSKFEDSASGRLFFKIKGSFADYEREIIRDRTMRGKRERFRGGLIVGGRIAYGYLYDAGKLTPDPVRAPVVERIYDWYDAGVSMRQIALKLRASGTPTWSGRKWGHSSVQRILRNETYAGLAYYGTHRREGKVLRLRAPEDRIALSVPALVEREQWERVQSRMAQPKPAGRPSAAYLLRGLLYCSCGRRMTGERSRKNYAYRCSGRDSLRFHGGPCRCAVSAPGLDRVVWERLTATFTSADTLRGLIGARESRLAETGAEQVADMESQARKLRTREERALAVMLDPDFTEDRPAVKQQYLAAKSERLRIESQIAEAKRATGNIDARRIEELTRMVRRFVAVAITPEQKQEFVRRLVVRVDWNGEELRMRCIVVPELERTSTRSGQNRDALEVVLTARLAA